jgi:hypothetical protein
MMLVMSALAGFVGEGLDDAKFVALGILQRGGIMAQTPCVVTG